MYLKILLLGVISLIVTFNLTGQRETNIEELNRLAEQFSAEWDLKQARVAEYAAENDLPIRTETEHGKIIQLVDVVDGKPVYISTTNLGAAITTRANELWEGGNTGLELSGENYDKLGVWDGGKVRNTHQEFNDQGSARVTQMDSGMPIADHPTHVAGTMIAGGVVTNAKGMAYKALLKAYDWTSDLAEMTSAAAAGMEISNHSYHFGTGWEWNGSWTWYGNANISTVEDYRFGFYTTTARSADVIAYNAPNYLITVAAANNRGEGPPNAGTGGNAPVDGGDDGYDCLSEGYSVSKNTMTVGAVNEVLNYSGPNVVVMSSFSGWGPVDDGRIKPDIVAKGVQVYSSTSGSNSAYNSYNGTSMACPNSAGTMALLQQHYQNLNGGTPMRSATLKGLVIHTSDETGPDPGPDYMFGWGLLNAERASQVITDDQGQNVMEELMLEDGVPYSREIIVPEGIDMLRVTVCWTDPPGLPVSAQLDPLDPMLVNDLDVTIVDENQNTYFPFKLDPLDPPAAATNDSKNAVDNVEMIHVVEPAGGTYTIHIDHEGSLQSGEQAFSIIVTGIDEYLVTPECADELLSPEDGATNVSPGTLITWTTAPFASSYDIYFGTDGEGIETPTNFYNGENFPSNGFSPATDVNTTYYLQVVPRNSAGAAEDCDVIWSFTTMNAINEFPYLEDVEDVEVPGIPEFWNTVNNSELDWLSTSLTSNSGNNAMGCYNSDGLIETDMDNWFISPPLSFEDGLTYPISFYYRNFIPDHAESLSLYWGTSPETTELNNLLFEAIEFTGSGWHLSEVPFEPSENGIYYLGWHATSTGGYGVFLDDFMVDAGTVGLGENSRNEARIYVQHGNIFVEANEDWYAADLKVLNIMGQIVYSGKYYHAGTIQLGSHTGEGLFFVSLQKEGHIYTEKLILSR